LIGNVLKLQNKSVCEKMKPKLHYHTHAAFFSGAENMISLFLQSEKLHSQFTLSFSYRYSKGYQEGLKKRVKNFQGSCYPLHFLHLHSYDQLPIWIPRHIKRIIFACFQLILLYPLFIYEVVILKRLLVKIGPDILHINNAGYPAALSARAAAIAGRLAGVSKVIMVVNNMAVGYKRPSRWLEYPLDRLIAICVDVFITGSKAAGERLSKVLVLPAHQIFQIHNGISLRSQSNKIATTRQRLNIGGYTGIVFGVVAILVPRKGHQVLLDAVLKLVTEQKLKSNAFKVLIEGVGPLYQRLVEFVVLNNLTSCVTFVGNEANVIDFIAMIDVLILPSVEDEDFPNVILEAMALGKPVIASRLAGTPEQVDSTTGLLVEPRNSAQLAEAIFRLIDNFSLRNSMGEAALQRYNCHFDSKIALDNYSKLYTKLIKGF
jgi:glycosyltransferase involved in cell wall biosynthesis